MLSADGALASRRVSGSTAGCLCRPNSQQRIQPPYRCLSRSKSRRLRQQLTAMLTPAVTSSTDVRVVTKDSVRVKRILAEMSVRASVDQVWKVLTDYNRLADFVPNLDLCERVAGAPPGKQRLRQRACSQSVFWRLQAEAVLDVQEVFRPMGRRELHFAMVEGDFQEFSGKWVIDPDPTVQDGLSLATILRYEVSIVPKWSLPSTLITTVVRCGLPANVRAIATRAEQIAQNRRQAPKFAKAALADEATVVWPVEARSNGIGEQQVEVLPAKGPARTTGQPALAASNGLDTKGRVLKQEQGRSYLGITSVPLPFPVPKRQGWERVLLPGEQTLHDRQQQKEAVQASYPSFDVRTGSSLVDGDMEVHLRRLDEPHMLHRRAVASINIEASAQDIWDVLTDYERLPEFVPNLAVSERLQMPPEAPARLVRLRQVGYKSMLYMHLHAEAVLNLVESSCREIQFRQVSGDFQLLQGKFILQDAIPPEVRPYSTRQETVLKYAVEVKIPRATAMLGLLEPLLERVVYQDIPINLEAIKRRVESQRAQQAAQGDERKARKLARVLGQERPTRGDLIEDFALLEAELKQVFGEQGPLPQRSKLRAMKRYDLEEAIAAHGGAAEVTGRMGWSTSYRVRGSEESSLPLEVHEAFEETLSQDLSLSEDEEQVAASVAMRQRPARADMVASFDVLALELRESFGEDGPLPSSTRLRAIKRHDLDYAIASHGGVLEVAKRMGWVPDVSESRPRNYWRDLEYTRAEFDSYAAAEGFAAGVLPSSSYIKRAKRYDLMRAVRAWGGMAALCDALGYRVADSGSDEEGSFGVPFREEEEKDETGTLHRAGESSKRTRQQQRRKADAASVQSLRAEIDSW